MNYVLLTPWDLGLIISAIFIQKTFTDRTAVNFAIGWFVYGAVWAIGKAL